uniref:purine-nucleoside phosphorylase n=1 Tax=Panagrolaimus davidi TaxID=227884 RepID=A0A914QZ65_9BILA
MRRFGQQIAKDQNIRCHEGIYVMKGGPNYETAAEIRFLQTSGRNAVESSTCHEVAVARQCGIKVFGFSLITNKLNLKDLKKVNNFKTNPEEEDEKKQS